MTDTQLQELGGIFKKNQELITTDTIKMLNTQLYLWYQYGQRIGINLIQGIESTTPQMINFFTDLIDQLLKQHGYISPPQITLPPSGSQPPTPVLGPGGTTSSGGATGRGGSGTESVGAPITNFNIEEGAVQVTAFQDESLQSTLERAAFRLKTQVA